MRYATIRLTERPPSVAVTVMRSSFPFARAGTTSESRRRPLTSETVCGIATPPAVALMTTFAPAADRPSDRVTGNEMTKRFPAAGGAGIAGEPMTGLTGDGGGGGGGGGAGTDAVIVTVLFAVFESGMSSPTVPATA